MDQTADPPYTNTSEGRARLAHIRHPLEDAHKPGCALLLHHQFKAWRTSQAGQTYDIYVESLPCDCGGRDHQAELNEAVEVLAFALRHPPVGNDNALEVAEDIVAKLRRALR